MAKISAETWWQVETIESEYRRLGRRTPELARKDWFLVNVKFTQESIDARQAEIEAYPAKLARWQKLYEAAPENLKTYLSVRKKHPPFSISAYDLNDALNRSAEESLRYCLIERAASGKSEKLAIRAAEFDVLDRRPHISSITVLDHGERVAALVEQTMRAQEATRIAEWGVEKKANRPGRQRKATRGKTPKLP